MKFIVVNNPKDPNYTKSDGTPVKIWPLPDDDAEVEIVGDLTQYKMITENPLTDAQQSKLHALVNEFQMKRHAVIVATTQEELDAVVTDDGISNRIKSPVAPVRVARREKSGG